MSTSVDSNSRLLVLLLSAAVPAIAITKTSAMKTEKLTHLQESFICNEFDVVMGLLWFIFFQQ